MESNCNFDGLTFTNEEIERLKYILESSFGTDDVAKLYSFLDCVFNPENDMEAFVCLDNRFLNLINIAYRAQYAKKNDIFEKKFYTKGAFWANIPSLFKTYADTSFCIDLGRYVKYIGDIYMARNEFNSIDWTTREYVFEYIKASQNLKSKDRLKRDFRGYGASGSYVYMYSSAGYATASIASICLEPFYQDADRNTPEDYIYTFFSKVLKVTYRKHIFSNTNISLSLYENDGSKNIHELFAKAAAKCNFVSYKRATRSNLEEEYFVRPLKDGNGNIFAFYTLTLYQSGLNGKYIITPYMIMSDFNYPKGSIPIFDNYKKEYDDMFFLNKTKAEALYLILNYNLLLLLEKECGEKVIASDRMDIDKIRFNFKSDQNNDLIRDLLKYKEPIWSLKQMDDFIFNGTRNSKPLFSNIGQSNTKSNINLEKALEDILISRAIKHFHDCRPFLMGRDDRGCMGPYSDKVSLNKLLNEVERLGIQGNQDVIKIMGEFLYLTNIGALGVDLDRDKDTYQCTLRLN